MRLTFLGSGSAFTVGANNYQSNMILQSESGESLLIDCGSDTRLALYELGLTYKDIGNVYISHLHADHVGGLEWLAFTRYFDPECEKPNLFLHKSLIKNLWDKVLSGGLSSIQGIIANLKTFFNVFPVQDDSFFTWSGHHFQVVQTVHIVSAFSITPCYGLLFTINNTKIFITTDTQFCPHQIMDFFEQADVIFHDCETAVIRSGVHAHYDELCTLSKEIKNKMWLYHYNPGDLPDAKKDGFLGFVQKGQSFDFHNKHCKAKM